VAFSPDGLRLATSSDDHTARVWDARSGKTLLVFNGHTFAAKGVAFSPDGLRLATASDDHTARVWDARSGQQLVECKGHTDMVWGVTFSPDGLRLATASRDSTARVWDAVTGQPLLVCKGRAMVYCAAFSPESLRLATVGGEAMARVWDGRILSEAEEVEWRLRATRPEPDWHESQFRQNQMKDQIAAAFHLDRLLAYRPDRRADLLMQRRRYLEDTLKQNKDEAGARLLLARTACHSPTVGPDDIAELMPSADEKNGIARRTRGGLLLRLNKSGEALPVLEAALKERSDDKPPVEELLLAWAYLDTNQPGQAKAMWTKATAWLDGQQQAVRAANVAGILPAGALPGVAPLFAPPADPRYNAFDWETWQEIDVLRRELAPRFAAQKP
jgi:hypothetical protein